MRVGFLWILHAIEYRNLVYLLFGLFVYIINLIIYFLIININYLLLYQFDSKEHIKLEKWTTDES